MSGVPHANKLPTEGQVESALDSQQPPPLNEEEMKNQEEEDD